VRAYKRACESVAPARSPSQPRLTPRCPSPRLTARSPSQPRLTALALLPRRDSQPQRQLTACSPSPAASGQATHLASTLAACRLRAHPKQGERRGQSRTLPNALEDELVEPLPRKRRHAPKIIEARAAAPFPVSEPRRETIADEQSENFDEAGLGRGRCSKQSQSCFLERENRPRP
jgi:hypothetical protein